MIDKDKIIEFCKEYDYTMNIFGQNPQIILLGENHKDLPHKYAQLRLIDIVRPKVVLHEAYYDEKKIEYLLYESKNLGFEMKNAQPEQKILEDMKNALIKIIKSSSKDSLFHIPNYELKLETLIFSRALANIPMGVIIAEELMRENLPLVGIYGAMHVAPESQIHEILRYGLDKEIGYITILQEKNYMQRYNDYCNFFK